MKLLEYILFFWIGYVIFSNLRKWFKPNVQQPNRTYTNPSNAQEETIISTDTEAKNQGHHFDGEYIKYEEVK
jgi:hypothetical protein